MAKRRNLKPASAPATPARKDATPGSNSRNVYRLKVDGGAVGVRVFPGFTDNDLHVETRNVREPVVDFGGKRNRWKIEPK